MKYVAGLVALAALIVASVSSPVQAGSYGMAGCGLGSMVFGPSGDAKDKIEDVKVREVLAATTNGTFMSQTFGITTGTSNCTSGGVAKVEKEQELFAEVNLDDLARDMAKGEGEYLTAYAAVLGCSAESQDAFAATTQANYEKIFNSADATPVEVISSTKSVLRSDASLAASCTRL